MPSALRTSLVATLLLALGTTASGCADVDADDAEGDVDESGDAVRGGEVTLAHPEVGAFRTDVGLCTGTLVRPNVVITAAHCFPGSDNEDVTGKNPRWTFTITTPQRRQHTYQIDRARSLLRASDFEGGGQGWRARDIALLHLTESVPSSVARPASLATGAPYPGEEVGLYGYGCTQRGTRNGSGTKRRLVYRWGLGQTLGLTSTANLCPGDSGGPVLDHTRNAVVGINSGGPATFDYFGNVARTREDIEAVIARW